MNKFDQLPENTNMFILSITPRDIGPGALYKILSVYNYLKINIVSLFSRPIKGEHNHYRFIMVVNISKGDDVCKEMFKLLDKVSYVQILGGYFEDPDAVSADVDSRFHENDTSERSGNVDSRFHENDKLDPTNSGV
jgi:prephenate dehydratase